MVTILDHDHQIYALALNQACALFKCKYFLPEIEVFSFHLNSCDNFKCTVL